MSQLSKVGNAVDVRIGAVGRLGKGDLARAGCFGTVAVEVPQAQPRQTVFALTGDEEAGEEIDILEHHGVAMGDALGPMLGAGRVGWRGDKSEVAAAIVGADVPQAVAVVDGILVLVFARADYGESALRLVGSKEPAFCGDVAGCFHHQELAVACASGAEVEALVVILIDQRIF